MTPTLSAPVDAPGTPHVFHDPAKRISLRVLTTVLRRAEARGPPPEVSCLYLHRGGRGLPDTSGVRTLCAICRPAGFPHRGALAHLRGRLRPARLEVLAHRSWLPVTVISVIRSSSPHGSNQPRVRQRSAGNRRANGPSPDGPTTGSYLSTRSALRRHGAVSRGSGRTSITIESPRNSGVRRTCRSIEDADIV
jgi:hypothetical protein